MRIRAGDPLTFSGRLRGISVALDPDLQLRDVMSMDQVLRQEQGMFRVIAAGLVLLTLSVVVLSAAGIYALMSCTVEQRKREIGIRAALGANPRRLVLTIFARALAQLAVGALLGVAVAALLETVSSGDFMNGHGRVILPGVAIFMMTVGLVAAMAPARRGLRIHPIETLRAE
jgi:ABC-type antimicrobial peptide transport system permease subunit